MDEDDVSFERHGLDPELDTMLVFDRDELVAWAELYRRRAEADVRPSHRGRGIGSTVLGWSEGRGRELGDAEVNQTKTDANDGARDLFLANGYQPRWVSWMIRMALSDTPPPPELPAGISIRPYRATDARDVHRVIDDAFTEWPGRDPEPYEVWASMIAAHQAFRPELSPLAFDGDELVGVVIVDDYQDAGEGWISQLATKATHRRRGIAQALLQPPSDGSANAANARRRLDRLADTGALGLYEKVGMRVRRSYTRYTKRLRLSGGRGIRTREAVAHLHALQACPFVRSGRPPPSSLAAA